MNNDCLDDAIIFAVQAHSGMTRKSSNAPYILHPLEAAAIVATITDDREILAAAVLHDVVEDTPYKERDIRARFGDRIADLVSHETENKRPELPPGETWRIRKEETLAVLRKSTDPAVKMLWMGDKLSNMRAIWRDYEAVGAAVFERFNNKNPRDHKWYYFSVLDALGELSKTPAYRELERLCHKVFDNF